MAVDLAYELWQELKRYINVSERGEAADTVVNILVDNDYSAEEIRDEFKGDSEIKRALTQYLKDIEEEDFDEEDEDDYDDEY